MRATVIAALLTIIGFSINDTIVIFDRIREDLKLGVRGSFKRVDQSCAQSNPEPHDHHLRHRASSPRCHSTCSAVASINDFAFTFLVGILTGTYSSIYIASALVLWWHKGQRPVMASSAVTMVEHVRRA